MRKLLLIGLMLGHCPGTPPGQPANCDLAHPSTNIADGVQYFNCVNAEPKVHVVTIDQAIAARHYEIALLHEPPKGPPESLKMLHLQPLEGLARAQGAIVAVNGYTWKGDEGYPWSDGYGTPSTTTFKDGALESDNTSACDDDYEPTRCYKATRWMGFARSTGALIDAKLLDDQNAPLPPGNPPQQYRHALYGSNTSVLRGGACTNYDSPTHIASIVGYGGGRIVMLTTTKPYAPKDLCRVLQRFGVTDAVLQDGGSAAQMFVKSPPGPGPIVPLPVIVQPCSPPAPCTSAPRHIAYGIGLVPRGGGPGGGADGGSGGGADGGSGGGPGTGGPGGTGCSVDPSCGTGSSWGDPHQVTLDRLAYDLQAAGEFVLLESSNDAPLVIQVRQQPLGSSRKVAVNTAIATRIGPDRIAFYAGRTPSLHVNGAPVTVTDVLSLAGGGKVARHNGAFVVAWPGSERLWVSPAADHLDVRVMLPQSRRGQVRGLLGNFNGDQSDDIATRTGTILSSPTFQELYASFAESWRLTQAESLFDYGSGESTATFADRSFPEQFASTRDLSDEQRTAARSACAAAGVTSAALLDACILDVALTGNPGYAAGAAQAQPPSAILDMLVNLAAGRPVTVAGTIGGEPRVVTDAVFAPEEREWNDLQYAAVIPAGASLTIDLGATYSLAQVVVQADNNDEYLLESSVDGVTWRTLVTVPPHGRWGLITRPVFTLPERVAARYARISAIRGDGSYSVSEVQLYGPPGLP